jgi:hypothetical protein
MRALIAGLALCLIIASALAASPEIEAAIKVYKAVGADPAKLKTFCEISNIMEEMEDKQDAATQAQINRLARQLGPDFRMALEASKGVDENSADGKVLYAAIDELEEKCPQ